jgi:hypothetical protein
MARSIEFTSSWSRNFKIADTVLSITLADRSWVLSVTRTWLCRTGMVPVRLPANLSLKSARPEKPSERQKRITVGWLTSARRAISAIGSDSTLRGCSSTSVATRCSAGDSSCCRCCTRSISVLAPLRPRRCSDRIVATPNSAGFGVMIT